VLLLDTHNYILNLEKMYASLRITK